MNPGLAYGELAGLAPVAGGDPDRYAALAGLLAIMVGGLLAIMVGGLLMAGYLARLVVVTRLLSAPVLTGYLAGSAIVIIVGQLTKVTGIDPGAGDSAAASSSAWARGRSTSSQAGDDRDRTRCDLSVDRVCVRTAETGAIRPAVRRKEFRWQTGPRDTPEAGKSRPRQARRSV